MNAFCGENCRLVLGSDYDSTDLLFSGIFFLAMYFIQSFIIYFKVKKVIKILDGSTRYECLKINTFEEQEVEEIITIESTGFDKIDVRRLFPTSKIKRKSIVQKMSLSFKNLRRSSTIERKYH